MASKREIEAAAKILHEDRDGRMAGSWEFLDEKSVVKIQNRATAKAILEAAESVRRETSKRLDNVFGT